MTDAADAPPNSWEKDVNKSALKTKSPTGKERVACIFEKIFKNDPRIAILNGKRLLKMEESESNRFHVCELDQCNSYFDNRSDLVDHTKSDHGKILCLCCDFLTADQMQMRFHIRTHPELLPIQCDICQTFRTDTLIALEIHKNQQHKVAKTDEGFYVCEKCDFKTDNKSDLVKHSKLLHGIVRTFRCQSCNEVFHSKGSFRYHKSKCKSGYGDNVVVPVAPELPIYTCRFCDKEFPTKVARMRHQNKACRVKRLEYLAENGQLLECDLCSFSSPAHFGLKLHKRRVHKVFEEDVEPEPETELNPEAETSKEKFPCKSCGETFETGESFVDHVKDGCEKQGSDDSDNDNGDNSMDPLFDVDVEIKTEAPEDEDFDHDRSSSRASAKTETNLCDYCGKPVKEKNMHRHLRMACPNAKKAKNLVLLECQECSFKTYYKSGLATHIRWEHSGKPREKSIQIGHVTRNAQGCFECPFCSLSINRKDNLKRHVKVMHMDVKKKQSSIQQDPLAIGDGGEEIRNTQPDETKMSCNINSCRSQFSMKCSLKRHLMQIHLKTVEEAISISDDIEKDFIEQRGDARRLFGCELCDRRFVRRAQLVVHMAGVHNQNRGKRYQSGFKAKPQDPLSMNDQDNDNDGEGEEEDFKDEKYDPLKMSCNICRSQFTVKFGLKRHLVRIHFKTIEEANIISEEIEQQFAELRGEARLRFSCEVCGKRFGRKSQRKIHITRVHKMDPDSGLMSGAPDKKSLIYSAREKFQLTCVLCSRKFDKKNNLVRHLIVIHEQSHEESEKIAEEICELSRKEKPLFHCDFCDKAYTRNYALKSHIKTCHE